MTTPDPALPPMLDSLPACVKQAFDDNPDELPPHMIVIHQVGDGFTGGLLPIPEVIVDNSEMLRRLAYMTGAILATPIVAVGLLVEVWMVSRPRDHIDSRPASEHPDRREVILANIEFDNAVYNCFWKIDRTGTQRALGEFSGWKRPEIVRTDFVGLLAAYRAGQGVSAKAAH